MIMSDQHANAQPNVARSCRSLKLGWTDPESGEVLEVEVRGAGSFLEGIEEHGFVVLDAESPATTRGDPQRVSVVAVAQGAVELSRQRARLAPRTDRPREA